jgi:hypothetical protein
LPVARERKTAYINWNLWASVANLILMLLLAVDRLGASMPGNAGQLGVRGDVRIGGRSIDAPSNVLAYNYYPSVGGDMVLDTDDASDAWGEETSSRMHFIGASCGWAETQRVLRIH